MIIQVYAPTEQSDPMEINKFYDDLSEILKGHQNKYLVMMGDFNAQVGDRISTEEFVLGKYGFGKRSKNGQKLIQFLLENNLILLNSIFKKNVKSKWTWVSPDGKYKNEIDYITSNYRKAFTNVSVIQNLNFNTNHRMVRAEINVRQPKTSRKNFSHQKYIKLNNTNDAITETNKSLHETIIQTSYQSLGVSEKYNKIEKVLKGIPIKLRSAKTSSLSEKTKNLIKLRRIALQGQNKKENLRKVAEISKKIRESMRRDRKIWRLERLEHHIKKTGGRGKALKELRETGKEWIAKIKKNNKTITKRREIY
ncbi:craniofacial development protein 2-like [Pararge aegeria]|uniref:craniofacial development protein 2-like n=1 Tax=Pararge aegeria TaxID=116150 RepID=UPI0019D25C0D|nr:craniofacial development protein 2-like [Pararge aegeria]